MDKTIGEILNKYEKSIRMMCCHMAKSLKNRGYVKGSVLQDSFGRKLIIKSTILDSDKCVINCVFIDELNTVCDKRISSKDIDSYKVIARGDVKL